MKEAEILPTEVTPVNSLKGTPDNTGGAGQGLVGKEGDNEQSPAVKSGTVPDPKEQGEPKFTILPKFKSVEDQAGAYIESEKALRRKEAEVNRLRDGLLRQSETIGTQASPLPQPVSPSAEPVTSEQFWENPQEHISQIVGETLQKYIEPLLRDKQASVGKEVVRTAEQLYKDDVYANRLWDTVDEFKFELGMIMRNEKIEEAFANDPGKAVQTAYDRLLIRRRDDLMRMAREEGMNQMLSNDNMVKGSNQPPSTAVKTGKMVELTAQERRVCEKMNVSEEKFLARKKARMEKEG